MSNQAQTALAAWLLQRPVKCTLSREESFLVHPKRHPIRMEYWAGCDDEGKLTALRARMVGDSGPYASVGMKVLERAAGHASGPYHVPGDRRRVRRSADQQLGMRRLPRLRRQPGPVRHGGRDRPPGGRGRHQRLGDALPQRGRRRARSGGPGQVMDDGCRSAHVRCLEAIKPAYDAGRARTARRWASGFGLKNSGLGNGLVEIIKAVVRFDDDGGVEVRHCWTEMGQGVHTVAAPGRRRGARRGPRTGACRRRHHPRARGRPDDRFSRAR